MTNATQTIALIKPTPVRRGYWRNRWKVGLWIGVALEEGDELIFTDESLGMGDIVIEHERFPDEVAAERRARDKFKTLPEVVEYLGPKFYPEA